MNTRVEPLRAGLAILTALAMVAAMMMLFGGGTARADHANVAVYEFNFVNGSTLSDEHGPGGEAPIPFSFFEDFYGEGNVPDGFEGLTIHVSCSDVFTDGWSDDPESFPDESLHEDWQIASYSIVRHTPGNTTPCQEVFVTTTTTTVADTTTTTVADTTTTTVADTTTTTVADTTTTTIPDEVQGTVITTSTTAPVVAVTTTIPDEVLDTQVEAEELPFTGLESDQLIGLAVLLLAGGLIALGVTGRREES